VAVIKTLRSVRYNERILAHAENLMAPPYDVISPDDQELYYDLSPFNVIRLILGKEFPDDTEGKNRYTRAREFLENWMRDGILAQDDSPSVYGYSQVYRDSAGQARKRDGFVALLRLEEWGAGDVFPHEHTYSGPKADRLKLLRATGHQLSCIFSLYSDPEQATARIVDTIVGSPEVTRYTDRGGVEHILTRCTDTAVHEGLIAAMRDKKVFVADGHHRYETMLAFRAEMREKGAAGDAHDYVLVYFVPLEGDAITILPCHRIVEIDGPPDEEDAVRLMSEAFSVETFEKGGEGTTRFIQALERKGKGSLGFYPGGDRYFLLSDPDDRTIGRFFPPDMKDEIRGLDVSILHHVVIAGLLSIRSPRFTYSHDAREALDRAVWGKYMAFIVNATKIEEIKAASLIGERMPQKSTFFYPKPASGLVFYRVVT
jgi:uncharacterized protein (DUF1015 family)